MPSLQARDIQAIYDALTSLSALQVTNSISSLLAKDKQVTYDSLISLSWGLYLLL